MSSKSPGASKRKQVVVKVLMLDDMPVPFSIEAKATGFDLTAMSYQYLKLVESDYFGLEYIDAKGKKCWLDQDKPVSKQVVNNSLLIFCVKFYTPDPGQLEEEYTRYLFALQVKRDLAQGVLICSDATAALLASYILQAEIGDYLDSYNNNTSYFINRKFFPHQNEDHDLKILDYHKNHVGQTPAEADLNLLDIARKTELYGILMHPAKDHEGVQLNLAVANMGILVFQNFTKINTFSWAKIRKLSFKRKKFLIKLHPENYGFYKDTVEFYFENRDDSKNFWKKCIENHSFFRCVSTERIPRQKSRLLSRGSSFRYYGRTQKELIETAREQFGKHRSFDRSYHSMRSISQFAGGGGGNGGNGGIVNGTQSLNRNLASRSTGALLTNNNGNGLNSGTLSSADSTNLQQYQSNGGSSSAHHLSYLANGGNNTVNQKSATLQSQRSIDHQFVPAPMMLNGRNGPGFMSQQQQHLGNNNEVYNDEEDEDEDDEELSGGEHNLQQQQQQLQQQEQMLFHQQQHQQQQQLYAQQQLISNQQQRGIIMNANRGVRVIHDDTSTHGSRTIDSRYSNKAGGGGLGLSDNDEADRCEDEDDDDDEEEEAEDDVEDENGQNNEEEADEEVNEEEDGGEGNENDDEDENDEEFLQQPQHHQQQQQQYHQHHQKHHHQTPYQQQQQLYPKQPQPQLAAVPDDNSCDCGHPHVLMSDTAGNNNNYVAPAGQINSYSKLGNGGINNGGGSSGKNNVMIVTSSGGAAVQQQQNGGGGHVNTAITTTSTNNNNTSSFRNLASKPAIAPKNSTLISLPIQQSSQQQGGGNLRPSTLKRMEITDGGLSLIAAAPIINPNKIISRKEVITTYKEETKNTLLEECYQTTFYEPTLSSQGGCSAATQQPVSVTNAGPNLFKSSASVSTSSPNNTNCKQPASSSNNNNNNNNNNTTHHSHHHSHNHNQTLPNNSSSSAAPPTSSLLPLPLVTAAAATVPLTKTTTTTTLTTKNTHQVISSNSLETKNSSHINGDNEDATLPPRNGCSSSILDDDNSDPRLYRQQQQQQQQDDEGKKKNNHIKNNKTFINSQESRIGRNKIAIISNANKSLNITSVVKKNDDPTSPLLSSPPSGSGSLNSSTVSSSSSSNCSKNSSSGGGGGGEASGANNKNSSSSNKNFDKNNDEASTVISGSAKKDAVASLLPAQPPTVSSSSSTPSSIMHQQPSHAPPLSKLRRIHFSSAVDASGSTASGSINEPAAVADSSSIVTSTPTTASKISTTAEPMTNSEPKPAVNAESENAAAEQVDVLEKKKKKPHRHVKQNNEGECSNLAAEQTVRTTQLNKTPIYVTSTDLNYVLKQPIGDLNNSKEQCSCSKQHQNALIEDESGGAQTSSYYDNVAEIKAIKGDELRSSSSLAHKNKNAMIPIAVFEQQQQHQCRQKSSTLTSKEMKKSIDCYPDAEAISFSITSRSTSSNSSISYLNDLNQNNSGDAVQSSSLLANDRHGNVDNMSPTLSYDGEEEANNDFSFLASTSTSAESLTEAVDTRTAAGLSKKKTNPVKNNSSSSSSSLSLSMTALNETNPASGSLAPTLANLEQLTQNLSRQLQKTSKKLKLAQKESSKNHHHHQHRQHKQKEQPQRVLFE